MATMNVCDKWLLSFAYIKTKPHEITEPPQAAFPVLAVSTFSCSKKSDSSGDSYVKFKLNGEWVTYDGLGELGPDLGNATLTDLGVTGTSKDRKNTFDISIQIKGSDFKNRTLRK